MAYSNTSHGSVHALFEASFQKLADVVSSDTATVSHKAHCDRIEKHLHNGILSSARAINLRTLTSSNKTALPHRHPANHLGNTDSHSHLDIFDEFNTEPKHWQTARVGKLVWLAKENLTFEYFCHTRVALGLAEVRKVSKGNVERPNLVLHSNYYSQISQNIAVLILDESHDCRNDESLYFDAVRSLEYHHLFMLTGTPMFNRSEDIVRQSRLMPDGGLFSSLEHFKALFYEDEEQQFPTGA
ncbi:hypothetical protein H9Q69_001028 [Fusarium xylarioides]|nr:hypothetical protein H9Q70_007970 [Fusarium xylarioides]KAG5799934.1 hypothetical protein H9Q69_001028 [Fusarium xylarioides]KAG5807119.1 hypothetical protein H9Q71_008311 [Fusarium xylarioides]KAG5821693.1 hypothetical protein H9Q74_008099 [Fusarium xylarioides]